MPVLEAAAPLTCSGARYDGMRVSVEVLGGELVQLGILQRFHLMHQPQRNVHAFAGGEFELLDHLGFWRFLDPDLKAARAQVERLGLELMEMQRAALTLANLENFAAVEVAVNDPYLAAPALGDNPHRLAYAVHTYRNLFQTLVLTPRQTLRRHTRQPHARLQCQKRS